MAAKVNEYKETPNRPISAVLADCPKSTIYVERVPEETIISVQINGFTYNVPRGVDVEVPKPVAELVARSARVVDRTRKLVEDYSLSNGGLGKKL